MKGREGRKEDDKVKNGGKGRGHENVKGEKDREDKDGKEKKREGMKRVKNRKGGEAKGE